jgi:hypothetical protein
LLLVLRRIRLTSARTETKDDAGRHPSRIHRVGAHVNADVIELRAKREMSRRAEVNSGAALQAKPFADAETPLAPAVKCAPPTRTCEGSDALGIAIRKPRPGEIRISVRANVERRGVIGAKIVGDSEPAVGIAGDGDSASVGIDSVVESFAKVGITDGRSALGRSWDRAAVTGKVKMLRARNRSLRMS